MQTVLLGRHQWELYQIKNTRKNIIVKAFDISIYTFFEPPTSRIMYPFRFIQFSFPVHTFIVPPD